MKKVSIAKILSFVILLLIGCHIFYYWPLLPDKVVSHFDAEWQPNGWMSRNVFMLTYIGVVALVALSFLGSLFMLDRIPQKWISLPNKAYWLASERKEATLQYIYDCTVRMHNVTQTFVFAIMHMTIVFNITGEKIDSGTFWILLAVYLVYMAMWVVTFYAKFGRSPADNDRDKRLANS